MIEHLVLLRKAQLEEFFAQTLFLGFGLPFRQRAQILEAVGRLKADDGFVKIISDAPATPDQLTQTQRHLALLTYRGKSIPHLLSIGPYDTKI